MVKQVMLSTTPAKQVEYFGMLHLSSISMFDREVPYHVHVLISVKPLSWHPGIKSQEGKCAEDILIQFQVIAVDVMRHLQPIQSEGLLTGT